MIRGKAMVEDFHCPAYYLLNTLPAIGEQAEHPASIDAVDLLYLENDEWFHYLRSQSVHQVLCYEAFSIGIL